MRLFSLAFIASVAITSADRQTDPTPSPSPDVSEAETIPKLPGVNAAWKTIVWDPNLLYIDKTRYLVKLLERSGELWYVTRPRRFGKSMFIDMAEDYFRGKKDNFKGLYVEEIGNTKFFPKDILKTGDNLPKWIEFPVIHLNLGQIGAFKTGEEFVTEYRTLLVGIAVSYELDLSIWPSFGFSALVQALLQKFHGLPIIVLVDEYDYPFQYAFQELERKVAQDVRTELNHIFTTIKNNVEYLGLALVTGVSKLGLPALESSGIIAFVDLTFDEDFAVAFGITETEITSRMGPNLRQWVRNIKQKAKEPSDDPDVTKILEDLVTWYDGYQFVPVNESCRVFNPVSTIQSIKNQKCESYWASTGSMAHLVDQFYREEYTWDSIEEGLSIHRKDLFQKIDPVVSPPPLHIWMLIFGYYTISSYDKSSEQVTLRIPNSEIREALRYNLDMYVPSEKKFIHEDFHMELSRLRNALTIGDTKGAMTILQKFVLYNYNNPLNDDLAVGEATRRLALILSAAHVIVEDSIPFCKDDNSNDSGGDIDLQTENLPVNYIFETRCTRSIKKGYGPTLQASHHQIGYLEHHRNNFIAANKKRSNCKIVAVTFQFIDRKILLHSWIAVPCVNGIVQFPAVLANSNQLKGKFLKNYRVDENTPFKYKKIICGPVP